MVVCVVDVIASSRVEASLEPMNGNLESIGRLFHVHGGASGSPLLMDTQSKLGWAMTPEKDASSISMCWAKSRL